MKKYKIVLISISVALLASGCGSDNLIKKGVKALNKEDYSLAKECFNEVIETEKDIKPDKDKNLVIWSNNMSEAYKGLGIAYYESGEYDKALEAYIESENFDGTRTPSMYRNMARCAKEIKEYSSACEYAKTGLELINTGKEEKNMDLVKDMYIILIESLEADGNFDEALEWVNEYDDEFPGDPGVEKEIMFLETR